MSDLFDDIPQMVGGASELLLDFGAYLTGGRRPPRVLLRVLWLLTLGGALALWRWFPWLFDHLPGWAVIAGGTWALLTIVTIGLSAAAVAHSTTRS